jgi:hypothetical protein
MSSSSTHPLTGLLESQWKMLKTAHSSPKINPSIAKIYSSNPTTTTYQSTTKTKMKLPSAKK